MNLKERKRIENILTRFRLVAFLFVFFMVPLNISMSRQMEALLLNRMFVFITYYLISVGIGFLLFKNIKNEKMFDLAIGISTVFDFIAIPWAATVILPVCDLPIEVVYIIVQMTMLIRYRTNFYSLIGNALVLLNIWLYELTIGASFYWRFWSIRGLFWTIIFGFNLIIFWKLLKNYDELLEQKELENITIEDSKRSIDNLIHINKISASLNESLSQNEIIKILLSNVSKMVNSEDCAVLLYSKKETDGYLYNYRKFKESSSNNREIIKYEIINIGDEIKKIKSMKDYKHVIGARQPFYMADLVNIYHMNAVVLNSERKWLYMFKIMCSLKEGGFLLIATDTQFRSETGQMISLLVGQAGTSLSTAVLYKSVYKKANTDPLTGAKTRRFLKAFLRKEIERSQSHNKHFCILFFDIDNFKSFNDTYGHNIGDEVLKLIYRITKMTIRKIDLVARYGGEEFVVVLPETEFKNAFITAERIRKNIEKCPIKDILDVDRNVTVSIGIAEYGVDGFSEEELINKADWGMYQAKSKGKNQVCSFRDYKIEYEQSQSMEDINTEQEDSKL